MREVMKIKKTLVLLTILLLTLTVTGQAVDLGLYQDFDADTSFRFDAGPVFVQPALDFEWARVGYKQELISEVYGKADIGFTQNNADQLRFDNLGVGIGYAIEEFGQKFRVEGTVINPVFTEIKDWNYKVGIAWQFAISDLAST